MENQCWSHVMEYNQNFIQENSPWDSSWYQIENIEPEDDYNPRKKPRRQQCTVRKVQQRQAANMRERRRMKTINEAFDRLRTSIPIADDDHKLSKVDTLRLAIRYIQRLRDIVQVKPEDTEQTHSHPTAPDYSKVIITYPSPDFSPVEAEQDKDVVGHSLSWKAQSENQQDRTLRHKVWLPESPSSEYIGEL